MKYVLVLIIVFLTSQFLKGQQISNQQPDSLIKHTFVKNGRFYKDIYSLKNEALNPSDLKKILLTKPNSASEINKYYRQKKAGLIMLPIFLGTTIIGSLQARDNNSSSSQFSKAPIPFSISVGSLLSSIIISATNNHLHKAIKNFNG